MTQTPQTIIEQAEILKCEDKGDQWLINVKWLNKELNPQGFAENTYMVKSIEETKPFAPGLYAFTISKGKLKKPDFDGTRDWMFYYTTHAVRTFEEQTQLDHGKEEVVTETEDLFEEKSTPKTYEQVQSNKDMVITDQVIHKEIGLTQRTLLETGLIKYNTLSEAREDLMAQSREARKEYRES